MEDKNVPMYLRDLTRDEQNLIIEYRKADKVRKKAMQKAIKDKAKEKIKNY